MHKLINKMDKYFFRQKHNDFKNQENIKIIKQIADILKKEKVVTIRGLKGIGKTKLISLLIQKSNYKNSYLYINKQLDLNNTLKNKTDLENLLEIYSEKYKKPKIIILENITKIDGIKKFINELYKLNYSIIIIGNNIEIGNKPEIDIYTDNKQKFSLINQDKYNLQRLKTSNIIYSEIIKEYSLKNSDLYNYTLIFLAKSNTLQSTREFNRQLNTIIKISLVTMSDYLTYSKKASIIKEIQLFDFKKNKVIESKQKYYFTDINFRNSLQDFSLNEQLLKENFLFLELKKRGYKIFAGKNGSYDFYFYGIKTEIQNEKKKQNVIFIDFCTTTDKQEIKKQINKLLKVPEIGKNFNNKAQNNTTYNFSKFLINDNLNNIKIRKTKYENLEILSLNKILEII